MGEKKTYWMPIMRITNCTLYNKGNIPSCPNFPPSGCVSTIPPLPTQNDLQSRKSSQLGTFFFAYIHKHILTNMKSTTISKG